MNERIKLLAEQAKIDYDLRPEIARAPVWIGTDEELEKFAELIILECAMFSMVATDDHYDVNALYRHFGIE
jgi:predicted transcriptional regulator